MRSTGSLIVPRPCDDLKSSCVEDSPAPLRREVQSHGTCDCRVSPWPFQSCKGMPRNQAHVGSDMTCASHDSWRMDVLLMRAGYFQHLCVPHLSLHLELPQLTSSTMAVSDTVAAQMYNQVHIMSRYVPLACTMYGYIMRNVYIPIQIQRCIIAC